MAVPRVLRAFAVVLLACIAIVFPTAIAAASDDGTRGDVDDFSYASWDAVYEVGLDDEGRARMKVVETLVARFPDFDQNRGIVRGLPTSYEGASTETLIISVSDENGAPVPYETEDEDGLIYILTGTDEYVQGLTTYVIEYEMRDVVLATVPAPESTRSSVDEFYWNLLPLSNTQPIERFRADIRFDSAMSAALTGSNRCYAGKAESRDECELKGPVADGDVATFQVESGARAAGNGVTVAIGFEPGTVTQPPARTPDPVGDIVPIVAAVAGLALSVGSWVAVSAFARRKRTATGIVIAQYDVPTSLPPLLAATLVPGTTAAIPAEIVHLAVRQQLRIEEGTDLAEPRLTRLPEPPTPDELDDLDRAALDAIFVGASEAGELDLPTADEDFATRMVGLQTRGNEEAESRGFTEKSRSQTAVVLQWCAIGVVGVSLALAIWGATTGRLSVIPAVFIASLCVFLVLLSSLYAFSRHTVLSREGALAFEYLEGVKEFIRVAEADRLRMLQSYSGAERRADGTADVIHLYERLLPYAILFGMESEWADVLEQAYTREERGAAWMGSSTSFMLHAQLATFVASSQSAASYTPAASSSAGGSYGGGFSGGGGGGGFSGGR
ncbi:DUF2207 domain-containing protein [Microbacterium sp. NPDC076768]|uniref:DUF2207 domain-containing protein n=1 Tax=Microbacterium sp. NPDC076768 TaxID=3154858 RepID=UPI0034481798